MSNSLWQHGLQPARLSCHSLSPGICSKSCSLSLWCYQTISFSATIFSCPQSFQTLGSFLMNWLFPLCGQSIGDSASTTVLPMNIWGWFPLGLTSLISLLSKRISRVFSSTTIWKHQFFSAQSSSWSNFHIRVSQMHFRVSQSFLQIKHSLKSKGPLYSLYICQIIMWHTWNLYKAIYINFILIKNSKRTCERLIHKFMFSVKSWIAWNPKVKSLPSTFQLWNIIFIFS